MCGGDGCGHVGGDGGIGGEDLDAGQSVLGALSVSSSSPPPPHFLDCVFSCAFVSAWAFDCAGRSPHYRALRTLPLAVQASLMVFFFF